MILLPPRSALFPCPTLFRSGRSSRTVGDAHRSGGNHHVLVHGQTRAVGHRVAASATDHYAVCSSISRPDTGKIDTPADFAGQGRSAFVPLIAESGASRIDAA